MQSFEINDGEFRGTPPIAIQLANQVIVNRKCNDFIFTLIYFIATIPFIVMCIIGFKHGMPERLNQVYDSDGRACGYSEEVEEYPFVYLVAPMKNFLNRSICVAQCPNWNESEKQPHYLDCVKNNEIHTCREYLSMDGHIQLHNITTDYLLSNEYPNLKSSNRLFNFSTFIYNSTDIFHQLCIPVGIKYFDNIYPQLQDLAQSQSKFVLWISDIPHTFFYIILCGIISFLFCYFIANYVLPLDDQALNIFMINGFVYPVYAVMQLVLRKINDKRSKLQQTEGVPDIYNTDMDNSVVDLILFLAISSLFMMAIYSLTMKIFEFNSRMQYAIKLTKLNVDIAFQNVGCIYISIIFAIIQFCFWIFLIVSFIYIFSIGELQNNNSTPYNKVKWNYGIRWYLIYHVFYGIWTSFILQAFCKTIIASIISFRFYNQDEGIIESIKRSVFYHSGSLVFGGAFLMLKNVLQLLVLDWFLCWSFFSNRFFCTISDNAYVQIALTSQKIMTAANNGYNLFYDNERQFKDFDGVGIIFKFPISLVIAEIMSFCCFIMIYCISDYSEQLTCYLISIVLVFIISYSISDLIFSSFSTTMDTILQCSIIEYKLKELYSQIITFRRTPPEIIEIFDLQFQRNQH